jgi:hypothetical protein
LDFVVSIILLQSLPHIGSSVPHEFISQTLAAKKFQTASYSFPQVLVEAGSVFFAQLAHAHLPGSQGHFSVVDPQLHFVWSESGSFSIPISSAWDACAVSSDWPVFLPVFKFAKWRASLCTSMTCLFPSTGDSQH